MRRNNDRLALHGGAKSVSSQPQPVSPVDPGKLKRAVCNLIDQEVFSDASAEGVIARVEREFADYLGVPYCLSFSSGTTALFSAYFAVGVQPTDEVIHPCYSWISAIAPIAYLGARPVLCEVSGNTLLIDSSRIEERIGPRTKAISLVHMHGNVSDMDAVLAIAKRHGLRVIEDCSHSHGARYRGVACGALGDIACFSMQGAPVGGKPIACGEGGFAVTKDRELFERMLLFAHINRLPIDGQYMRPEWNALSPFNMGMKFRAHPWALECASLGLHELDRINARKRELKQYVEKALAEYDCLLPVETCAGSLPGGFYGGLNFRYRSEKLAETPVSVFLEALNAEGVAAGPAPCPLLHRLPLFRNGPIASRIGGKPAREDLQRGPAYAFPASEKAHAEIINVLYPMEILKEDPYVDQMLSAFGKVCLHIKATGALRRIED